MKMLNICDKFFLKQFIKKALQTFQNVSSLKHL